MAVRLPRTIRLDASDTFVFSAAAEPGEWAVTGTFLFFGVDPASLSGKERQAFRAGFLGLDSFGWSTLAVVTEASAEERAAAVERLAAQLVRHCGAPDLMRARAAAEEEIAFAESLCDHEPNTLLALQRKNDGDRIRESFRTLHRSVARLEPANAFRFVAVEDEEEGEAVDLAALAERRPEGLWISCGHHLLDRDAEGRLVVTDAFLKAYLARPGWCRRNACEGERRLQHELLMHHRGGRSAPEKSPRSRTRTRGRTGPSWSRSATCF